MVSASQLRSRTRIYPGDSFNQKNKSSDLKIDFGSFNSTGENSLLSYAFGAVSTGSQNQIANISIDNLGKWETTGASKAVDKSIPINIKEGSFENINPEDYYGPRGQGGSGSASGGGFDFQRAERFDIEDTKIPEDSAIKGLLPSSKMQNDLWNKIRENLVAGADGQGLFSDDAHLNRALNSTLENFNGASGTKNEFAQAVRNEDVLSHATAAAISKKGIHENGFGKLYEAYAKIDNVLPDNIVNRAYLDNFNRELQRNGNNVIEALAASKHLDNKTYGLTDVDRGQVKAFADLVNRRTYESLVESLGFDKATLDATLLKYNGINPENKNEFYNISGAMATATALDTALLEKDNNGKTGFQRLVDESNKINGTPGQRYSANVNFHIRNKSDDKTDGTAFGDFSQNGVQALTSLQKHIAGLSRNPMLANQFNFVFKDEAQAKQYMPEILKAMEAAGIDVNKMANYVEGHGDTDGAMTKSGTIGGTYQGIGKDDSEFFASLLEYTPHLQSIEFNYDSCFGFHPAKHNAEAVNQAAQARGMNIAVAYEGSRIEGLVTCYSFGENNNQDRFIENPDGTYSASVQRKDGGGTDERDVLYSQGQDLYTKRMLEYREQIKKSRSSYNPV